MEIHDFKKELLLFAEQADALPEPLRSGFMREVLADIRWELSLAKNSDALDELVAEAEADIAAGRTRPMEDVLREARAKRLSNSQSA